MATPTRPLRSALTGEVCRKVLSFVQTPPRRHPMNIHFTINFSGPLSAWIKAARRCGTIGFVIPALVVLCGPQSPLVPPAAAAEKTTVAGSPAPAETAILDLGSQRYLLFDDDGIEPGYTVTFVQHSPEKRGIVLEADRPWENLGIWPWNTVMHDEGVFKLWYDAMTHAPGQKPRFRARLAYATSRDGIHWEKPELGLYEFEGSTKNNLLGEFSWLYGSVFKDPTGPDARRYKITYISSPAGITGVGLAWSPDGLRWTPSPRGHVMDHITDSADVMFWDDRLRKYVGYFRHNNRSPEAGRFPREVWRAETDRVEDWPKPTLNFRHDPNFDVPGTDFYNNGVIKYPWAHHAYFMRPSAFHRPSDRVEIQLATSRDGVTWRRPGGGRPWLGLGPEGSFDSHQLYISSGIVRAGDELWMYYTGLPRGHGRILIPESKFVGRIARSVLRLDGFVSARGGRQTATLTTKPLRVAGGRLVLNYDAGATGEVRAELRDESNRPLPGFTLEECKPLFGNRVHGEVTWGKGTPASAPADRPLRLHLQIRNADVYAFEFRPSPESRRAVR